MKASLSARIKAFFAFWYDFVVGDDWRVAIGVAGALAITYVAARNSVSAWWIMPVAVVLLLSWSLFRATRQS